MKIGFTGQLLIEPKPKEPMKHQYDYGKGEGMGWGLLVIYTYLLRCTDCHQLSKDLRTRQGLQGSSKYHKLCPCCIISPPLIRAAKKDCP